MIDWQPIETAPKDGKRVIAWSMLAQDWIDAQWVGGKWISDTCPIIRNELVLWFRPEPPSKSARDQIELAAARHAVSNTVIPLAKECSCGLTSDGRCPVCMGLPQR